MINGKITKIKNNNEEVLFPITTSQAVLMSDGVTNVQDAIEENRQAIEENISSLQELIGQNVTLMQNDINEIRGVL